MSWSKAEAKMMKDMAVDVKDTKTAIVGDAATGRPGLQEVVRDIKTDLVNNDRDHALFRKVLWIFAVVVTGTTILSAYDSDLIATLLAAVVKALL